MTEEVAIELVNKFLDSKGYTDERVILATERMTKSIDVHMLKPYGLFIVRNDGTIIDNY